MLELREQVALLTEQLASLSTRQSGYQQQRRPRCFICGQIGCVQCSCLAQSNHPAQSCLCFSCGQPGHLERTKETNRGCLLRAIDALVNKPYLRFK